MHVVCPSPGAPFAPKAAPGLACHRLFGAPTPFENRLIFGPSQNKTQEVSQSTLGRPWLDLGSILYAFGVHFGGRFWLHFSTFSKKPKTLILDDLMVLLHDFTIPKALFLRPFFASFSDPVSGPLSGGSFWPILAHQSADLYSSGRFWVHFGDPGFSKKAPWATPSRPETSKKAGSKFYG